VAILSDLVHRPWSLEGKRIETVTLSDSVTPMSVGLAPRARLYPGYAGHARLLPRCLSCAAATVVTALMDQIRKLPADLYTIWGNSNPKVLTSK
jgi:hypothetical protein